MSSTTECVFNRREQPPDMVTISERPAEAEDRAVPGHWEGDLIIGTGGRSARSAHSWNAHPLLMLSGRTTTSLCVTDLNSRDHPVARRSLRRLLTWDQGRELATTASSVSDRHAIYFCDPSAWQQGSKREHQRSVRQYFPKGTNLTNHDHCHSTPSPISSTDGPAKPSTGRHPPKPSLPSSDAIAA